MSEAGGPVDAPWITRGDEIEAALLGRRVDLIMPEAVTNPYVQADIARDRTTVYGA